MREAEAKAEGSSDTMAVSSGKEIGVNKPFPLQTIKGKAKEATQNIKGETWRSVEVLPGIWVAGADNKRHAPKSPAIPGSSRPRLTPLPPYFNNRRLPHSPRRDGEEDGAQVKESRSRTYGSQRSE